MIIILHSTQLPENLGAVARVMGNFNLSELRLITPLIDPCDLKALATSAGADHILQQAKVYPTLQEATSDLHTLIGTCADVRIGIRFYESPQSLFDQNKPFGKFGILFGPERTGLSQEDLSLCHATLQIPVCPDFSSMNLSHAVAIICYSYFVKSNTSSQFLELGSTHLATQEERDIFFNTLENMLDHVGYWRVASKKHVMRQNLKNFFSRSSLTKQEIQTLLGMFQTLRQPR